MREHSLEPDQACADQFEIKLTSCLDQSSTISTKKTIVQGRVMRVGSDTFGDPNFQKGLQN